MADDPDDLDGGIESSTALLRTSRLGKGNWFAFVPGRAVIDPSLTDGELRALYAAAAFAGPDRICRASQDHIANRLGVFRQTVNKWFRKLEALGYLIKVGKVKRKDGAYVANIYRVGGFEHSSDRFTGPEGSLDDHDPPPT